MGEVYRARDTRLGRDVALKILPEERASDPDRLRRFETEARAVASLNHPHILALYDVGTHDGVPYAVTELLGGRTLRSVLGKGPLPARKVVDYGVQICRGLAAAHEQGVIHRDLKPENVFVTRDGRVKILDFGLAKLTGPADGVLADSEDPTATEPGVVMGTAAYMSPEQARGRPADARSDLFSVGAILYEMLSGQRAFTGETPADTLSAVLDRDPPEIQSAAASVPPALERVVKRCLEKSPQERTQSAGDLARALEALPGTGERRRRWLWVGAVMLTVLAAGTAGYRWLSPRTVASGAATSDSVESKRLVVLPFENLGAPEDAYFAAGITDEITSRLAQVSGLRVISRTSAVQYDRTGKSKKEIGRDFDVAFVLEGTVRWDTHGEGPDRVRITPQLVRVADDTPLWSDSYDGMLDDIFASQSKIAAVVVEQLGVALLPREQAALGAKPTESLEAYQAYLRGLEYWRDPDGTRETYELAVQMFERAVALDPSFVEAYSNLAEAHLSMYTYDNTPARLARAREAVDRALALDADSPDAHLALGRYCEAGEGDRERALAEYTFVADRRPNDSHAVGLIAGIRARQGRFDQAIADYERALDLDPRNPTFAFHLAELHQFLGRYSEAHRYHDLAIATAPDKLQAWVRKAFGYMQEGRLDRARATAEGMPEVDVSAYFVFWSDLERRERRYEAALERLDAVDAEAMPASSRGLWEVIRGDLYRLAEQPERARVAYEVAVKLLEGAVSAHPEDPELRVRLAQSYAGLGRRADAGREAERILDEDPLSWNRLRGSAVLVFLAEAYTTAGEHDKALEVLESLVAIPSWMSYGYLRYEPALDPLREDPRFQKLLAEKKRALRPSSD